MDSEVTTMIGKGVSSASDRPFHAMNIKAMICNNGVRSVSNARRHHSWPFRDPILGALNVGQGCYPRLKCLDSVSSV